MFQTAYYKERRDTYKRLAKNLKTKVSEHQKKKSSASNILSTYKSSAPEMSSSDLPSKHYVQSAKSITENMTAYINKMKSNHESLTTASSKASALASEYDGLYVQEKAREDAYRAEQARQQREREAKEREQRRKNR